MTTFADWRVGISAVYRLVSVYMCVCVCAGLSVAFAMLH